EQKSGKAHAQVSPSPLRPTEAHKDQKVDRCVFEKVDTVGEQRHRTDRRRDGELDAEIAEVEQRHQGDGATKRDGLAIDRQWPSPSWRLFSAAPEGARRRCSWSVDRIAAPGRFPASASRSPAPC